MRTCFVYLILEEQSIKDYQAKFKLNKWKQPRRTKLLLEVFLRNHNKLLHSSFELNLEAAIQSYS